MATIRETESAAAQTDTKRAPRRGARDLLAAIGGSLGFDHAVEYYDETRGLSPEVQARTAQVLAAEFGEVTSVLDVGAGTGLVAVPLARRGVPMIGLDISAGMLQRLASRARDEELDIPVMVGDATHLPFGDDSFDGVVMRHVLHLVHGWRTVLKEVRRVMRPGGRFAVSITDYTGLYHTLQERFLRAAGGLPIAVGLRPDDPDTLKSAMHELGATAGPALVVRGRRTLTIEAFLHNIERGVYTWTWAADTRARKRAVGEVRRWARSQVGDLRRPVEPEFEIEWRVFRFGSLDIR